MKRCFVCVMSLMHYERAFRDDRMVEKTWVIKILTQATILMTVKVQFNFPVSQEATVRL